ncbi:MAG TPA: peptidase domain-containing ABC transporter [Gemmataceae bacterium]|nr:peptidase domain-containing ABC transporter [Gemmataceae bacterium]
MWRRYVWVRQNDQSDCGAAALATVALHYRRSIGLEQVRDWTGTDRIGATLLGLLRGAEKLGFASKAIKAPYEALARLPLPAIAHLRTADSSGHFLVLHKVSKDAVVVADPACGVEKRSRTDFCRDWTGHLLMLVPQTELHSPRGTTPQPPWRRFLGLLRSHTGILTEAIFCALLMTLLGVSTSYFVQHLVDSVLVRQERRLLNALGIGMVLIVVFRTLFALLRQYLLAHVARKVDLAVIAGYSRHLLGLPMRFFESRRVGEILSRAIDTAKVREAISGTTTSAVVDGVLVVLLLGVLWMYDFRLALTATAFVPVLLVAAFMLQPATLRHSWQAMENWSQLSAHLIENVSAVQTIKAFGAERARAEEGERQLVGFVQANFTLQKFGLSMNGLGLFLTALAGVIILWYGGNRVMDGALTIGQLMFFYSLLVYLLEPLNRLAGINLKLQEALVAVDRLYQVLDLELEQPNGASKTTFPGLQDGIELRDVTFRYGSRGSVLDKINLRIPAGKTVAVVGESGSGKSTLLNLLMGFHAPTEGAVLVDGVDLRDFDLDSLRGRIGLVSQEPFIFNGTVRDNIVLGRPEATLDEVIEAARSAGLSEFIANLPQRYDTLIGERGANLSGGQRQRLAIARALLRKPDVLLFDEATSHLDTATEQAIQENLHTVLSGRTVILVAHRLSTIKDADLIYVLHQGRIAEQGTHRQLLAQQGLYSLLCRKQTGAADESPLSAALGNTKNGKTPRERISHA